MKYKIINHIMCVLDATLQIWGMAKYLYPISYSEIILFLNFSLKFHFLLVLLCTCGPLDHVICF